jgi:hypothetical protein
LGIAIGCLCEKNEHSLVEWTKSVGTSPLHYPNANIEQLLRLIIGVKQLTINEVDKTNDVDLDSDDSEAEAKKPKAGPSTAAIEKLEDFSGYRHLISEYYSHSYSHSIYGGWACHCCDAQPTSQALVHPDRIPNHRQE